MNLVGCFSARCFLIASRLVSCTFPASAPRAGKGSTTGSFFKRVHWLWFGEPESDQFRQNGCVAPMWDGRRLKSRTQSAALIVGNVGKGKIYRGKGEKSGITVCVSNQFELLMVIQRRASRPYVKTLAPEDWQAGLPFPERVGEPVVTNSRFSVVAAICPAIRKPVLGARQLQSERACCD